MVFNQSLLQGIFPENFKVSKVTLIDKGGGEMDPFNYRPISTLSAPTQIFEKIICEQLVNYLALERDIQPQKPLQKLLIIYVMR